MPVVVTGASGYLGRLAVAAFARTSPEVRAYIRRPETGESLRRFGAKVAVGAIEDVDTLTTVMSDAHTVCHLVGGLDCPDEAAYEESNLGSVVRALEAARRAGVARFLFLSYPGAAPKASNPYLRFKGMAERAVRDSGLEHVIIRSTHVLGRGSPWLTSLLEQARRWPALVVGTGRQLVAPVFEGDVAAVLAAADDRHRVASGTWGLEGPERLSADELTDHLAGRRTPKLHLSPAAAARLSRLTGRPRSRTLLEVVAMDCVADAPDAATEFGVSRTPFGEGLARSLGVR